MVGHVHNALVTCPVYNGTCAKSMDEDLFQGTVHVCVGNGGMSLDKVPKTAPAWGDFMASDWGYATLDVANKTHLTVSCCWCVCIFVSAVCVAKNSRIWHGCLDVVV